MYDYAHCLSDALEGITHSLCTLEFEDHRPLYDWFVDKVDLPNHPELWQPLADAGLPTVPAKPRQIEFSRLNLSYCITSKRKLAQLVERAASWMAGTTRACIRCAACAGAASRRPGCAC